MKRLLHCCVLQLALLQVGGCQHGSAGMVPPTDAADVAEIRVLLEQSIKDDLNLSKRIGKANEPLTGLLGRGFWRGRYPVEFAYGHLLLKGRSCLGPLRQVGTDPRSTSPVRVAAWRAVGALNGFDDPDAVADLVAARESGLLSGDDIGWIIAVSFPFLAPAPAPQVDANALAASLVRRLRDDGFEATIKLELDDTMSPTRSPSTADQFHRRWLNRLNDHDLDDWLAARGPELRDFRRRQRAVGVDPADSLADYLGRFESWDEDLKLAARRLFPDPNDQACCVKLTLLIIDAEVNGAFGSGAGFESSGWEDRLRSWYRANRDSLKYDMRLHRLNGG